jgi:hypothetical protein
MLIALLLSQCSIGIGTEWPRLWNKSTYHMSSAVVKAMDLYSASTVGLDIVACFFAPQDMRLGPIKIPNQ